ARTGSGQRDRRTTRAPSPPSTMTRAPEPTEPNASESPTRVCEPHGVEAKVFDRGQKSFAQRSRPGARGRLQASATTPGPTHKLMAHVHEPKLRGSETVSAGGFT